MAINWELAKRVFPSLAWTVVRRWDFDGHEAVLVWLENVDAKELPPSLALECECDFDYEEEAGEDGETRFVKHYDPEDCPAKKRARAQLFRETVDRYGADWKRMGAKKALLDLHRRVKDGLYFGQTYHGMVYLQEVSKLLGVDMKRLWKLADELYREERLELNGAILTDYVPRFRFPHELKQLMRLLIESPLGWPNGDAGDGALYEMEAAVQEHTRWKHGRDVFGANWAWLAPGPLFICGAGLLLIAGHRLPDDLEARKQLKKYGDLPRHAAWLKKLAGKCRKLKRRSDAKRAPKALIEKKLALPGGDLVAWIDRAVADLK
jgi:hypothetical protein